MELDRRIVEGKLLGSRSLWRIYFLINELE